ncbi:hypothetical protein J1N35_046048 [Gossypium stocksii]|uniref:EF-hand domain-containing protein n=1 Tax=Gossypium stocksii TaxID=47602 RepID=A0A9D3U575_9ROSI|nr:hypothetical protein J1N35_046048 [Gossypium stocksii]
MVTSLLLLALLFIAGFLNVYFYISCKKFHAWLQSFFPKTCSSSGSVVTSGSKAATQEKRDSNKLVGLKRVFATFDKNEDWFIMNQELRESLKNIKVLMTEKEVEDMVVKVDANGDGLIGFEEFCILCQAMDGGDHASGTKFKDDGMNGEEELKEALDVFDIDKDGLISFEESGSVPCSLGLKEGTR